MHPVSTMLVDAKGVSRGKDCASTHRASASRRRYARRTRVPALRNTMPLFDALLKLAGRYAKARAMSVAGPDPAHLIPPELSTLRRQLVGHRCIDHTAVASDADHNYRQRTALIDNRVQHLSDYIDTDSKSKEQRDNGDQCSRHHGSRAGPFRRHRGERNMQHRAGLPATSWVLSFRLRSFHL